MTKLRPDSVIGSLPANLKDEVDAMLLSGSSYKAVRLRLAEDEIKLSQEAIRKYYHSQILPAKLARQTRTAAELNKIAVEGLDEATLQAIRSAVFDLATSPTCDPKALNVLFGLVLKAEQMRQDETRLKILVSKAEQADAAKQITQSTLTPEERDSKMRAIFGC